MKPARALQNVGQGFTQRRRPYGGFVCLQCQCRASKASVTAIGITPSLSQPNISTSFNAAASTAPFAERLRKKIWGTNEPPGPENPSNDKTVLDNVEAKQDAERAKSHGPDYDTLHDDYIPSKSWDGLERIGGATGWWEDAWDQENQFRGFSASRKMDSREELSAAIHQALVEIYTLSEAGRPLADASNATLGAFEKLGAVSFLKSEDGTFKVIFPEEAVRDQILRGTLPLPITQKDPTTEPPMDVEAGATPDVADGVVVETTAGEIMVEQEPLAENEVIFLAEPSDNTWMDIYLTESTMRFHILRRVMQLTGSRIPDPEIEGIKSAKALLGYLVKKPKPKKLADALLLNDSLVSSPNVQVMERRYTPIDSEKEVGRWKVIESELERRKLPVTGSLT